MARAYAPRDPNRPAPWFKVKAGIACHARTLHLANITGKGAQYARGLVLAVLDAASRSPMDGRVDPADLTDPVTYGLSEHDIGHLEASRWLVEGPEGLEVREWRIHQDALIQQRLGGAKGGKGTLNPASRGVKDVSSPSSVSNSNSVSSRNTSPREQLARDLAVKLGSALNPCRKQVKALVAHGLSVDDLRPRLDGASPGMAPWDWAKFVTGGGASTGAAPRMARFRCIGCGELTAPAERVMCAACLAAEKQRAGKETT